MLQYFYKNRYVVSRFGVYFFNIFEMITENKNAFELYNRNYRSFANVDILSSRVYSVFHFNYLYIYYIFTDLPQRIV